MRILITGASRGIGLEFTRQYLQQGHHVLACCRNPETAHDLHEFMMVIGMTAGIGVPCRLDLITLDVTDADSLAAAEAEVREHVDGIDLLLNNAGIFPRGEDHLAQFDPAVMLEAFRVNSVAPLAVVRQFHALLRAGVAPKIVNLGSGCGSVEMVRTVLTHGSYSYKCSKAALNIATLLLAHELRPDGIAVMSVQPGWVRTDMTCPEADLAPEESVAGMVQVIAALTLETSGGFIGYDGQPHVW